MLQIFMVRRFKFAILVHISIPHCICWVTQTLVSWLPHALYDSSIGNRHLRKDWGMNLPYSDLQSELRFAKWRSSTKIEAWTCHALICGVNWRLQNDVVALRFSFLHCPTSSHIEKNFGGELRSLLFAGSALVLLRPLIYLITNHEPFCSHLWQQFCCP